MHDRMMAIHLAPNRTAVSNTSRSGWTEAGMFWWHRHCATLGDVQWFKRRTCQNAAETVTHAGRRLLRTIAVDVGRECMQQTQDLQSIRPTANSP